MGESSARTRFHFIAGLPRAGSTLLAAILGQNPRFRAGMTSPVGMLFDNLLAALSAGSEFAPVTDEAARRRLLRGLFDNYYADCRHEVVFDTNRLWAARLPALCDLFPGAKVIACVRNVAWVMDSLERLVRANPYEKTRLFSGDAERNTVYSRVESLALHDRLVGFAYNAVKEAYYGEHAAHLLVVDYDLLAAAPDKVLRLIYQFIGEPWFEHDFANIRYDAPAFDGALGLPGLHRVRPRVALEPRRTVLPPDLFDRFAKLSFWNDGSGSAANVIRTAAATTVSGIDMQVSNDAS